MASGHLEQCYNRGCGQKYDPANNNETACSHHPGAPVFHDAYKGWSCCNKKCTDFTEFLNIKGCTLAKHSNVKPPEPEKPSAQDIPENKVIKVKPIVSATLERPPIDSPLTQMEPEIAPSLQSQIATIEQPQKKSESTVSEIALGTNCKNTGCTWTYRGEETNNTICLYHPGSPIFHEGLKYWSCCQKKTTDFNAFLNQEGCQEGVHLWTKEIKDSNIMQCRWDHHQTGPFVVVSIYAKQYSPSKSVIKLNPVRLYVNLVFPQQNDANFELDLELKGIVDVPASKVTMYGTKVEIKLKKAEAGSWSKLETRILNKVECPQKEPSISELNTKLRIEPVDLSGI